MDSTESPRPVRSTTKPKQYLVRNPRGIPEGVRVFRQGDAEYFEGDSVSSSDLPPDGEAWLLAQGILEEVSGG